MRAFKRNFCGISPANGLETLKKEKLGSPSSETIRYPLVRPEGIFCEHDDAREESPSFLGAVALLLLSSSGNRKMTDGGCATHGKDVTQLSGKGTL